MSFVSFVIGMVENQWGIRTNLGRSSARDRRDQPMNFRFAGERSLLPLAVNRRRSLR
jgi:hypothetical protein